MSEPVSTLGKIGAIMLGGSPALSIIAIWYWALFGMSTQVAQAWAWTLFMVFIVGFLIIMIEADSK